MIYFSNAQSSLRLMLSFDILFFSQIALFTIPSMVVQTIGDFYCDFISEFKIFGFPFGRCWLCGCGKVWDVPLN